MRELKVGLSYQVSFSPLVKLSMDENFNGTFHCLVHTFYVIRKIGVADLFNVFVNKAHLKWRGNGKYFGSLQCPSLQLGSVLIFFACMCTVYASVFRLD